MICFQKVSALSLKISCPLLAFLKISTVIVFTATPRHAWRPGPDATLLIIWRRWRLWSVVYLVFLQASWSPLLSPQISKVIVFTATPCHVWHPGPDATLLIIWRRWRTWTVVYLVFLQASWSPILSRQISKVIVFTATPHHAWCPGPDATLLIIWMWQRVWTQVYLVLCTATPSPPPLGPCVLQVLCKLLSPHTVCICCFCWCSLCNCISSPSSPCTKEASQTGSSPSRNSSPPTSGQTVRNRNRLRDYCIWWWGANVTSHSTTWWNFVAFHPCWKPSHWGWVEWWHGSFFSKNWWNFPLHPFAS